MTDQNPAGGERTAADERRATLTVSAGGIMPKDFEQIWRLATVFAASGEMVPKIYRENPNAACMAIMWGLELGISPIQAIQGIAVIGGKPAVWGDLLLAICQTHPKFQDLIETPIVSDAGKITGFRATAKRTGRADVERAFTMDDALKANLLSKDVWKAYPQRMLQMRARSWALRDQFADGLRGMASADEMQDVIEGDFTQQPRTQRERQAAEPIREPQAKAEALPAPQADLLGQLAGTQVASAAAAEPVTADQADHAAAPVQGRAASVEFADLETRADFVVEHKPLTKGDQKMLEAYLTTAGTFGVTEQDLFDQLGDFVNKGNLKEALAWLQGKCAEGSN